MNKYSQSNLFIQDKLKPPSFSKKRELIKKIQIVFSQCEVEPLTHTKLHTEVGDHLRQIFCRWCHPKHKISKNKEEIHYIGGYSYYLEQANTIIYVMFFGRAHVKAAFIALQRRWDFLK